MWMTLCICSSLAVSQASKAEKHIEPNVLKEGETLKLKPGADGLFQYGPWRCYLSSVLINTRMRRGHEFRLAVTNTHKTLRLDGPVFDPSIVDELGNRYRPSYGSGVAGRDPESTVELFFNFEAPVRPAKTLTVTLTLRDRDGKVATVEYEIPTALFRKGWTAPKSLSYQAEKRRIAKAGKLVEKDLEARSKAPNDEDAAAASLRLIKQLIQDGKEDAAAFRLKKLADRYPGTKAAKEAEDLLKKLEK
jgi:hypothetical protein